MCDLDNLKIDNLDFDTKHRLVQEYEKSNANPEYIDSYCFNLFTIAYLNKIFIGKHFFEKEEKLPKELRTKENRDIYESMYYLDSTYQKKYLIDNLR